MMIVVGIGRRIRITVVEIIAQVRTVLDHQIGMRILQAVVDDGDHNALPGGQIPCDGTVDILAGGAAALTGILQVPLLRE